MMRFCTERQEERQGQEGREQMRIEQTVMKRKRTMMEADTLIVQTVLMLFLAAVGVSQSVQSKISSTVRRAGEVELLAQYDIDVREFEGLEDGGVRVSSGLDGETRTKSKEREGEWDLPVKVEGKEDERRERTEGKGREGWEIAEKNKRQEEGRKGDDTPLNCCAHKCRRYILVEEDKDEWDRMKYLFSPLGPAIIHICAFFVLGHVHTSTQLVKCNAAETANVNPLQHIHRVQAVAFGIPRETKLRECTCKAYGVCDEREDLSLDTDQCAGAGSCGGKETKDQLKKS
ncbi:hypothetical protein C8R45DRAFT_921808 [Mycena sanguinolenta]|nr:hypothetical protein C8R45DRAFT_921808 [Mycena sanguinolenta]